MKVIQNRLVLLTSLCSMVLLFSLLLFIKNFVIYRSEVRTFFVLLLLAPNLLVVFLIREFEVYNIAKLIVENKIMHIAVAEIEQKSQKLSIGTMPVVGIDIFISCFGILLGSKVIKFNTEGINLKKVEIGNDFICIAYGKGEKSKIIRLLHGVLGKPELQSIIDRFRHETGIIPIVVD